MITNQFGSEEVVLRQSKRLLVPSSKSLAGPADPLPEPVLVDHFQCYAVAGTATPLLVTLEDQLNPERLFLVKKPRTLCVPADKNGEGIQHADNQLLCYDMKKVPGFCSSSSPSNPDEICKTEEECGGQKKQTSYCERQPKDNRTDAWLLNQFGESVVAVKKPKELCVPSDSLVLTP